MKFIKTKNTYKASNLELNLNTMTAVSYNWWTFLKVIDGALVFNSYAYSPSTQRQQSKVLRVLSDLGIKIDLFVESRLSLDNPKVISDAIQLLEFDIKDLNDAINKKGSQKAKNAMRTVEIVELKQKLYNLELFIHKTPVMVELQ